MKLISVSDASNQTLDLGSREDITDTQKELLALPAPNQILILAHGQGYIVIRNVNDIMQVDYINPTRPLSSIDFFQKVMIQLGLSAFGEPPSKFCFHPIPLSLGVHFRESDIGLSFWVGECLRK